MQWCCWCWLRLVEWRGPRRPYTWEDDLHQRLLADFCLTEQQVKDYIRKYIPEVTDEQMRRWEKPVPWSACGWMARNVISSMPVPIFSG